MKIKLIIIIALFSCCMLISCDLKNDNITPTEDPIVPSESETPSPTETPEAAKSIIIYTASEGGEIRGLSCQEKVVGEFTEIVEAVPKDGYYFKCWSDGKEEASRSDIACDEDNAFIAYFEKKIEVIFKTSPTLSGQIQGTASQLVIPGENSESVTAVALSGYKFVKWSDGDENPTRTVNVSLDSVFTAVFEEISNIPNLYITTDDGNSITNKDDYKGATLALDSIVYNESIENLTCEVKGHGNSSWDNFKNSKPSYNLKLSEKISLAGVGAVPGKQYTLISNHGDALMLRNYTALTLGSRLSNISYTVDFTFVNLYVNGKAMGLYQLCEKIKVGETRIDIEVDETGETLDTGYLLELDQRAYKDNDNTYFYIGDTDVTVAIKSDGKSAKQKSWITEYVTKFYNECVSGDKEKVAEYADINSIVDMFILQEFTKNRDAGFASFYMIKEQGEVLKFTCPWDFDLSLGNDNMFRKTTDLVTLSKGGIYNDGNLFFVALYKQDWFKEMVRERLLAVEPIIRSVIEDTKTMYDNLHDAYITENELWDTLGRRLLWEPDALTKFTTYEEHIEYYINWMNERLEWMKCNI